MIQNKPDLKIVKQKMAQASKPERKGVLSEVLKYLFFLLFIFFCASAIFFARKYHFENSQQAAFINEAPVSVMDKNENLKTEDAQTTEINEVVSLEASTSSVVNTTENNGEHFENENTSVETPQETVTSATT